MSLVLDKALSELNVIIKIGNLWDRLDETELNELVIKLKAEI